MLLEFFSVPIIFRNGFILPPGFFGFRFSKIYNKDLGVIFYGKDSNCETGDVDRWKSGQTNGWC